MYKYQTNVYGPAFTSDKLSNLVIKIEIEKMYAYICSSFDDQNTD